MTVSPYVQFIVAVAGISFVWNYAWWRVIRKDFVEMVRLSEIEDALLEEVLVERKELRAELAVAVAEVARLRAAQADRAARLALEVDPC